jgi:hypothetical protein
LLDRFLQVDPEATQYADFSAYHYAGNNPVLLNDPTGATYADDMWQEFQAGPDFDPRETQDGGSQGWGHSTNGYEDFPNSFYGSSRGLTGPTSGNHWSDGMQYRDWTLHGGSDTYRRNMAAGALDVGGNQYVVGSDGQMVALTERGGVLGHYEPYNYVEDGVIVVSHRFVATQQGATGNLVLSFLPLKEKAFAGSNWDLKTVRSLEEAAGVVANCKNSAGKLKNLIILSHGSRKHLNLAYTFEAVDLSYQNEMANFFTSLLGQVDTGGDILFYGCRAGLELGVAMQEYVRCDVNIYMNMDPSSGLLSTQGDYFFRMDTPITMFYENGVRNVTTGAIYRDITVGRNGTITPER